MNVGYLPWGKSVTLDDRPCVRDLETELTYGQFNQRIDALAGQLSQHMIGYGDIVAIMMTPRVDLLVGAFAAWRAGAAVTLVDPALDDAEIQAQLGDSGACLVLALEADVAIGDVEILLARDFATDVGAEPLPHHDVVEDELAIVLYRNPDIVAPVGVMLTHGDLIDVARQMSIDLWATGSDHALIASATDLGGTTTACILSVFLAGGQLTLANPVCPKQVLRQIRELRPTVLAGDPELYEAMAALPSIPGHETASVRVALTGDVLPAPDAISSIENRLGLVVVNGYGNPDGSGIVEKPQQDSAVAQRQASLG